MSSLRDTASEAEKILLRKVKELTPRVKLAICKGANDPGATMQFVSDVRLYNLWEALLYVEGYEKDGYYEVGTAKAAFQEAIK